jgi:hypothetical protein
MTDDMVGKIFIALSSNGDLPLNPMRLRECLVCGGVFTRQESRAHWGSRCQPSSEQPFAIVTGRGSKSEPKNQTWQ